MADVIEELAMLLDVERCTLALALRTLEERDGVVLVPVKASEAMQAAAYEAYALYDSRDPSEWVVSAIYDAMIAARPTVSSTAEAAPTAEADAESRK